MTLVKDTDDLSATAAVFRTDLPFTPRYEGKVRDLYQLPADGTHPPRMLIVATDRISAFDVVMPTPIPGKGRLLTEISTRWFHFVRTLRLINDHLLSTDPADVEGISPEQRRQLEGRMTLARAVRIIPVECVVRGYLAGSGWVEYSARGTVCGIELPPGLRQCERLPEPIFTPATKASVGHDENIDFERASAIAPGGQAMMRRLRETSVAIYRAAAAYAEGRGIILADTKFEFGLALDAAGQPTDELLLADEIFTPDSSRFWPADRYEPGRDQESFDKQYLRNYLLQLVKEGRWAKNPPGPPLPEDVVANTASRYREARDRLFGALA